MKCMFGFLHQSVVWLQVNSDKVQHLVFCHLSFSIYFHHIEKSVHHFNVTPVVFNGRLIWEEESKSFG